MLVKLGLQRPLILLAVGPVTGALGLEGNAGAKRTLSLDRNVGQPLRHSHHRLLAHPFHLVVTLNLTPEPQRLVIPSEVEGPCVLGAQVRVRPLHASFSLRALRPLSASSAV